MGRTLPIRTVRGADYIPTQPYTGSESDSIFLLENMIQRGREDHKFYEAYQGEGPVDINGQLVALTGTLDITTGSATVVGTGTLFLTECHLGQFILLIDEVQELSLLLVVKRIVSDTEMEIWQPPNSTYPPIDLSDQTGWRMDIIGAVNDQYFTMLRGNIIKLDKGSILSVGDGTVQIGANGLPGFSLTATREPQISVFDPVTNSYTNYTLGMGEPPAPTLAAVGGGTKSMQGGSYSAVVTRVRTATGGYNNPSERADVTIATNDRIAFTFPAMDTTAGQDAWGVWVTTFADTLGADLNYLNGPWHYYITLTTDDVPATGGTVNLEWLDAEVETNEIISFNNDAPPQAEFILLLNFNPVLLSCRGPGFTRGVDTTVDPSPGPFISPSKPNNIEAFPVDVEFSSSPPETILGGVSAQGRLYLSTPNHLQIAQATPDDRVPIIIRPYWDDGFANPYQVVFLNGMLYGYTVGGPSRSVGEGDEVEAEKSWAAYVSNITNTWNPGQVLVAYHPGKDAICFFHAADKLNDEGFWTTRVLMYGIPQQRWISNVRITRPDRDSIVSGVATVGEKLLIRMGGRGAGQPTNDIELPMLEVDGTGTVAVAGSGSISLPMITVEGTGTVV